MRLWLFILLLTVAASCGVRKTNPQDTELRAQRITQPTTPTVELIGLHMTEPTTWDTKGNPPSGWGRFREIPINGFPVGTANQPGAALALGRLEALTPWQVPKVRTILLGYDNVGESTALQAFRAQWILTFGTGGAREEIVLDALRFTRVTVPAETFDVAIRLVAGSASNDVPVRVFYEAAEGNSNGLPQFTSRFALTGNSGTVRVPVGAVGWRVHPVFGQLCFNAATRYTLRGGLTLIGELLEQDLGPDMQNVFTSGNFLPLPLGVQTIDIELPGPPFANGSIIWKLDI